MKKINHLTLLFCLFLSLSLSAKQVHVMATKGKSVTPEQLSSITDLITAAIEENESHNVVPMTPRPDFVIKSKLMKLGDAYILSMAKYVGNKRKSRSKMKAKNFDEMDVVVSRLTRAVVDGVKVDKTARIGEITKKEVQRISNRRQALKRWQASMGPAWVNNLNIASTVMNWGLGLNFDVTTQFTITMLANFLTAVEHSDASLYRASLGVNYHLLHADNSPYIGAQFGYGRAAAHENKTVASDSDDGPLSKLFSSFDFFSDLSEDTVLGMNASAVAGMSFFRASTVSLAVEVAYTTFFAETALSKKNPSVLALNLVVVY